MSDGSSMQATGREAEASAGSGSGPAGRDFGDSAGYGSGGSTRDYRDVLGEDEARRRPNPLDAVMTIPPHRRRSDRASGGRDRDPSADLVLAAAAMLAAALGVLAWRGARDLHDRRRLERRRRDGAAREALARYQV